MGGLLLLYFVVLPSVCSHWGLCWWSSRPTTAMTGLVSECGASGPFKIPLRIGYDWLIWDLYYWYLKYWGLWRPIVGKPINQHQPTSIMRWDRDMFQYVSWLKWKDFLDELEMFNSSSWQGEMDRRWVMMMSLWWISQQSLLRISFVAPILCQLGLK